MRGWTRLAMLKRSKCEQLDELRSAIGGQLVQNPSQWRRLRAAPRLVAPFLAVAVGIVTNEKR